MWSPARTSTRSGFSSAIGVAFRRTASAVPAYQPTLSVRDEVGLQDADAGAEGAVEIPGAPTADVVDQRAGAVLGQDEHPVDPRVHAVGQREVDDPVLAAERDGGLGAVIREDGEALAGATGQDDGNDVHRRTPHGSGPGPSGACPDDRRGRTSVKVHMVGGPGPTCASGWNANGAAPPQRCRPVIAGRISRGEASRTRPARRGATWRPGSGPCRSSHRRGSPSSGRPCGTGGPS